MAESFEVKDPDTDIEEASYGNYKGFFGIQAWIMRVLTIHELQQNYYPYYITLRSIFSWCEGYFPEKDSDLIEKKMRLIRAKIIQIEKEKTYNEIKAAKTSEELDEDLYQCKKMVVRELKKANLLIGVREKGSDLYA